MACGIKNIKNEPFVQIRTAKKIPFHKLSQKYPFWEKET